MKLSQKNIWLWSALIVAAVLRFWNFHKLQFHHDEMSALLRTRFDSFESLISHGVIVDGHPALTQFFLWVYTSFGIVEPWFIKLPFAIAGVLSVYVLYLIGKELMNTRVALLSAALMASLQLGIIYSQWARPYALGVLFVLLATYYLILFETKGQRKYLIGFALFTALSAYTHYFALLQIMIVSGLLFAFWISPTRRIFVVVASIVAAIIWLPHLSITLFHLRIGGIGDWLSQPKPDFLLDFVRFTFNYSPWLIGVVFVGVLMSVLVTVTTQRLLWLKRLLLFGMVFLPFLIGYIYSVEVSSLLHFGAMFFAYPFLLLLAASFFFNRTVLFSRLAAFSIMLIATFSLIDRHHFQLNYATEFMEPSRIVSIKTGQELPLFSSVRGDGIDWLYERKLIGVKPINANELHDTGHWHQMLRSETAAQIMVVTTIGTVPQILAEALNHYPVVDSVVMFNAASAYLLSKGGDEQEFLAQIDFCNAAGSYSCVEDPLAEFSPSMSFETQPNNGLLHVRTDWAGQSTGSSKLVLQGKRMNEDVAWLATDLPVSEDLVKQGYKSSVIIDLRDVSEELMTPVQWSTYIWNPSGNDSIDVFGMKARLLPDNALRYRLFEE